jgi:hypothetical protein
MSDNRAMEVMLANPRGFCAGVERAIAIVERALEQFGAPIYVRHEIVHNKYVVDDLRAKGAVFVEELDEVPAGSTVIFSAHGVAKHVRGEAERRGLKIFDATCPLVTKVHVEVAKMLHEGYEIVMIGHRGHPEAEGTMGQAAAGMHLVETDEDVAELQPTNGRLAKVTPGMDDAARSLGASPLGIVSRVHVPLLAPSLLTAALMVFVDVMKELPVTFMMRPFNFDTLAVHAYNLASDERLSELAAPALTIVVVGIVPLILLSRTLIRARLEAGRR